MFQRVYSWGSCRGLQSTAEQHDEYKHVKLWKSETECDIFEGLGESCSPSMPCRWSRWCLGCPFLWVCRCDDELWLRCGSELGVALRLEQCSRRHKATMVIKEEARSSVGTMITACWYSRTTEERSCLNVSLERRRCVFRPRLFVWLRLKHGSDIPTCCRLSSDKDFMCHLKEVVLYSSQTNNHSKKAKQQISKQVSTNKRIILSLSSCCYYYY